jgi:hypothetical protein
MAILLPVPCTCCLVNARTSSPRTCEAGDAYFPGLRCTSSFIRSLTGLSAGEIPGGLGDFAGLHNLRSAPQHVTAAPQTAVGAYHAAYPLWISASPDL